MRRIIRLFLVNTKKIKKKYIKIKSIQLWVEFVCEKRMIIL